MIIELRWIGKSRFWCLDIPYSALSLPIHSIDLQRSFTPDRLTRRIAVIVMDNDAGCGRSNCTLYSSRYRQREARTKPSDFFLGTSTFLPLEGSSSSGRYKLQPSYDVVTAGRGFPKSSQRSICEIPPRTITLFNFLTPRMEAA